MHKWLARLTAGTLALAVSVPLLADVPAYAFQKPAAAQKGQKGQARGNKRMQEVLGKLNLSAEQKAKVKELMTSRQAEMRKLKDATPEEKKAKGRELQKSFREKLNAILTPEQQKQLREAMPARGKGAKNAKNAQNAG